MKKLLNRFAMTTAVLLVSGCTGSSSSVETNNGVSAVEKPVNCSTAETDIRLLEERKKTDTLSGIIAHTPVGIVVNEATSSSDTTLNDNKIIDHKIAEIKTTCGLK